MDWKSFISTQKNRILFFGRLLRKTAVQFVQANSFFHGAALAYYTVFAMVPLLYLSITFFGWFVGNNVMIDIITEILVQYVGIQDISGILNFLEKVDFEKGNFVMNAVGIVALAISSTALLTSLRASINTFYAVEVTYNSKRKKLLQTILARLVMLALMTILGLIIIVFYFFETILLSFSNRLFEEFEVFNWLFNFVLLHTMAVLFNVIIFLAIFKFLHDGIVRWRYAWYGALFTGTLLYLGQILIKYYLTNLFFASDAGVAGSLLLILVWMYYSSQIVFLGAKFTKVCSEMSGTPIKNKSY